MKINRRLLVLLPIIAVVFFLFSCKSTQKVTESHEQVVHEYMATQQEQLAALLPNAEVSLVDDSIKVLFKDGVMFESNSTLLKDSVLPSFMRFAKLLITYGKTRVLINGHTDNQGSDKYNYKLSNDRAHAAQSLLVADGVKASRLYPFGLGKNYPIADNNTPAGRALNRRIEIIILYDEE